MKNRWLIAASAVGLHMSIGSVYAWSVATNPLKVLFEADTKQISFTFGLAIFFLGLSAAVMGHFVEKHGPRKSGSLAALFFGLGVLGAGVSVSVQSLTLLYLTYGVLGGIGLGIGYISPVSTLVKWFPDRRGLATGLAIMGFGFGALLAGPVMNYLIVNYGVGTMFYVLGATYLTVMLSAAQYLAPPPKGWLPEGLKADIAAGKKELKKDISQMTANEAVKTKPFYGLWIMLYINVTCGIAVISVASPMAQEIAGMTALAAAGMVGLMGLFNGIGRICWASFSDIIGRPNTYITFFALQIVIFLLLPTTSNALLFQVLVFAILTCYGGGFATLPAFIGDLFGTKQLGAIHGYVLTAWAAAGLSGSTLAAMVRDATGSYSLTLYIFSGLFLIALATSLAMRLYVIRAHEKIEEAVDNTEVYAS